MWTQAVTERLEPHRKGKVEKKMVVTMYGGKEVERKWPTQ
jgi:hypothetical protein